MPDAPSRAGVTGSYLQTVNPVLGYGVTLSADGRGSGWFGPSAPLNPVAPDDVVGRQFDYPVGFNLLTRTRAYAPIGFRELRDLADGYDLLRTVIETRKDQLARMSWTIKSRDAKAKDKEDPRVAALTTFFQRPDGVHGWHNWLRPILEDLFVLDAPALYLQRNRGGQLIGLLQIDGATIKPIIDDWGRTPQPYSLGGTDVYPPAYQQVLKGLPAVDYSVRDLVYRPRNRRIHTPYGMGPVEQIVTTVSIALRRQLSTLSYFTEGNIPDAIAQLPQTWTPDQIVTFQQHWDSYFSGDLGRRRRVKFVPGTGANNIHETRQADLKGDFDEWLAKLVCFAFSISPQALTRQMNRASADTQKQLAEEEGLQPILLWLKSFVDEIIATEFNADDLEFAWDSDDDVDRSVQQTILTGYATKGMMTIDEARQELGLDPFNTPESTAPMVLTATGFVPLGSYQEQQEQAQQNAQALAEARAKQEALGAQGGAPNGGQPPQGSTQAVREPTKNGDAVAQKSFNPGQARDEDGRWASGASGTTVQDARDWHAAKDNLRSIAKGVAITAASGLAVALLPEEAVAAVVIGAVTKTVAGTMFTNAALRSGEIVLRRAGLDTAAIGEKLKPIADFMKDAGDASLDEDLAAALTFTVEHARDELIADVESKHEGSPNLAAVVANVRDLCDDFTSALARLGKVRKLGKRKLGAGWRTPEPIPFDRPATRKAEAAVRKRLRTAFKLLAGHVTDALRKQVDKVAKAAPDDPEDFDERVQRRADEIVSEFDLGALTSEADALGDDLEDVVEDTIGRAVAQIGPDDSGKLIDQVNARAFQIARDRAAELVGMRYDDDGQLVPSDDPEMAITDGTRDMLRQTIADGLANNIGLDAIADDIADTYAFSDDRAAVIAATEVSRANSMASLESYRGVADAGVAVRKAWLVATSCCDLCAENAAAGPIALDDAFPSGDDTPPGHPNCRCSLTPVVGDDDDTAEKAYNPSQARGTDGKWTTSGLPALKTAAPNTEIIGEVLGRKLPTGAGYMPAKVHSKIKDKRPDDYVYIIANLNDCLRKPDFAGESLEHPGRINLVLSTPNQQHDYLLVSQSDERDAGGQYTIITAFPFKSSQVAVRVMDGTLRATKKGP